MAKKTVLHIEDSGIEREIVRRLLEEQGFEVVATGDPLEGIKLAQNSPPDLILIDLHLPDMDGYATAESLREIPSLKTVPIITLSATISQEERMRCESLFDGFLDKPIDVEAFPGEVQELLSRKTGEHPVSGVQEEKEEQKRDYNEETREVLESLERIRAAMSHDLRTPLTVMISYANTVSRGKVGEISDQQKEMLDMVVEQGFQMDSLISELVRIARHTLDLYGYPPKE